MKVWINRRTGGYSGGLLLVAANSKQEAHEVFHQDKDLGYMWDAYCDGTVCDYYYKPENWKEVPNLWYAGVKPCIIAEDGYTE